jgi:microcystin degradation protein MlrC
MNNVLVASIWQESNSFVPIKTDLDDFRRFHLLIGNDVIEGLREDDIEVSGIIKAAEEDGISLIPALAAFAFAGGPVTDQAYVWLRDQILQSIKNTVGRLDGVILSLHGAMLTPSLDDAEGELVEKIRQIIGPQVPIVCSLDMHAYLTKQMSANANALVGYRTHPHIDFFQTGYRAMKLMAQILRGEVHPFLAHVKLRMIARSEKHNTNHSPMADVIKYLDEIERSPQILTASIFPEHELLDVPQLGFSVIVNADGDKNCANKCACEIADFIWTRRRDFLTEKSNLQDALRFIRNTPDGPFVLADASDATSGGSSGDSTYVLKGLLDTPVGGTCLLTLTDPDAVTACIKAGVGSHLDLQVGGKLTPSFYKPIEISGTVESICDGKYKMRLPATNTDIGHTIVFRTGEIYVVLSEKPAITFDEEVYHHVGLSPRQAKLVLVKSHGGFRAVYEPFAKAVIDVDTPGPCNTDVSKLPYQRMTRPIFPLDEIEDEERYYSDFKPVIN